ncbi:MAG: hypothetical protein WC389_11540 [Lutibacter sp.]|jgi:hypothetical protein
MKKTIKNEITDILSGKKGNRDIFIADTYGCDPGFYRYDGKIYNQAEFNLLTMNCNKVIVFTLAKGKTELPDITFPITGMNIIADSPETAETFLQLRNIKKE